MAWNYFKTGAIICAAQFAVRLPLTYVVDQHPFATGGVFWAGAALPFLLLPIMAVMDLVSSARQTLRNRQPRAGRSR